MPLEVDLERLKDEYANRRQRLAGSYLYSVFNLPYLFAIQQRQRKVLSLLQRNGFANLLDRSILEVGCGSGGVLLELVSFGASPQNVYGIDLLHYRLSKAKQSLPFSKIACADGQHLPYPGCSFDLVLQYTAFSSILDVRIKKNIANEMIRVMKPGGIILWYDFWINPFNKHTRGIGKNEIRSLFPRCEFEFHKITLAPPIARRIVPLSWVQATFLESLQILNSHFLVAIHPLDR